MQKAKKEPTSEKVKTKEEIVETPSEITAGKDWIRRTQESKLLSLPSGVVIKIKKNLSLLDCAFSGYLPMALIKKAMNLFGETDDSKEVDWTDLGDEEITGFNTVLERIAVHSVIEPKLSMEEKEDCILVSQIPKEDLLAIFSSFNLEKAGEETKSFRTE